MRLDIAARMPSNIVPLSSDGGSRILSGFDDALKAVDALDLGAMAAKKKGDQFDLAAEKNRLQVLKFDALAAAASGDRQKAAGIAREIKGVARDLKAIAADNQVSGEDPQTSKDLADATDLARKILDFLRRAFAGRSSGHDVSQLVHELGSASVGLKAFCA